MNLLEAKILMTLALLLIKNIELYFNMYLHSNIVGGHYKKMDVFKTTLKESK